MKRLTRTLADRDQWAGFERWAAGLASTAIGSWGVRRGGWVGLLAVAGAGLLAFRAGARDSMLDRLMPAAPQPEPALALEAPKSMKRAAPRRRAAAGTVARAKPPTPAKRKMAAPSTVSEAKPKATAGKRTNGAAAKPIPVARSRAPKPALSS